MTELEIFVSGGGTALLMWAINLIFSMGKAASGQTNDF
jgi:hypothetical protein